MSRDPLLAGVELRTDHPLLAQRTPDLLAHLADGPLRVEVLADGALRGDDRGVLVTAYVVSLDLLRHWGRVNAVGFDAG